SPPPTCRPRSEWPATPSARRPASRSGPPPPPLPPGAPASAPPPEALSARASLPAPRGSLRMERRAPARAGGAVAVRTPGRLDALLRELAAGHPVVILQNLSLAISPVWHYAVAIGYDLGRRELVLRSGPNRRETMALSTFEHTWARGGHWAFVALPPGRL